MYLYKLISYIFHPLLFSFIGSFIYLLLTPKHFAKKQEYILLLIIFISTYILPIFLLAILKKLNLIKTYRLESIEERKFPILFFIILSFMVGNLLLNNIKIVDLLAYSFFGTSMALAATYFLFYLKIKTSLHTLGIGGILGFVLIMSYEYKLNFNLVIALLFILSGIIAFSRLKLNAHKPEEVYIGFLIAMITQLISYQFYHNI